MTLVICKSSLLHYVKFVFLLVHEHAYTHKTAWMKTVAREVNKGCEAVCGLWREHQDLSHSSVLNPRLNATCTAKGDTLNSVMASSPIPTVILSTTGILLSSWWFLCISLMSDFMLVVWCLALDPNTQQRANVSIWRSLLSALGGVSWENCPASQFSSFLLQNQCRKYLELQHSKEPDC